MDIDNFKGFNDIFGHPTGDLYLLALAELLHQLLNKGIFCARYGGDEFVIVYEEKTEEEVLGIAEKLRQDVMDLEVVPADQGQEHLKMTISQGICSCTLQDEDSDTYFLVADQSLFEVKKGHKNSIKLAQR